MVNSVTNMGSSMAMMQGGGMKRPPPPPQGKDVFQVGDSDGDGVISASELAALAEGIEDVTGNSINVEDALSSYDANKDGGLSGEELLEMMKGSGFTPPEISSGEESGADRLPPPPPSSEQALAAYGQNSGNNQITQLLELPQDGDSEKEHTSVDVTS